MILLLGLLWGGNLFAAGGAEKGSAGAAPGRSDGRASGSWWTDEENRFEPSRAQGFSVIYGNVEAGEYALLTIQRPWESESSPVRYLLLPPGSGVSASMVGAEDALAIDVPVRTIATLSSTYLSPLVMLGEADSVIAHDNRDYVGEREILDRFDSGDIVEVGNGPGLNVERLLVLDPDLVMATGTAGEWNVVPALADAGLKTVINADYLENSPLGRAEWIGFISLFYGKEAEANRLVAEISGRYLELARMVRGAEELRRPTVLLNNPFGATWVLPGGESYMARLLEDAGARYLWSGLPGSASSVLDLETVFYEGENADFWLHQYGWKSLADVVASDRRFAGFRAVRNMRVVNNDGALAPGGGNEFYGSGVSRPDLVLEDLVSIFHPELLPDHELVYYRYLPKESGE
jgi:iron complex transport system substrate-binding protein